MDSRIVDPSGPAEGIDGSLPGLVVLPLDHLVDIPELVINLLENDLVLFIKHPLVLLHLHVNMLDPLQFLFQHPHVVLVVSGDVGDRVFAGNHPVVLMHRASVDTVDAKQFELVLAVKSNEIVMD